MLIQYCPSCGAKNEYMNSKPRFCNQCSSPFDVAVAKVEKKKPAPRFVVEQEEEPSYNGFAFEIEDKPRKVLLDDVVKQPKQGAAYGSFGQGNFKPGDALLEDIRKECSSSRGKPISDSE